MKVSSGKRKSLTISAAAAFLAVFQCNKCHAFSSPRHPAIIKRVGTKRIVSSNDNILLVLKQSFASDDDDLQQKTIDSDDIKLDQYLSTNNLRAATRLLQKKEVSKLSLSKSRFLDIFRLIEIRTAEAEENNINTRMPPDDDMRGGVEYPPSSPARTEMTEMYQTLQRFGQLKVFGAAGAIKDAKHYPAEGSKNVSPHLLETITGLSMSSLTPQPTNTLLYAGAMLAVAEGITSLVTGISLNFLAGVTLLVTFLDKFLINGAIFETATSLLIPEYRQKIVKHEAGHFLCAYLLECPVEGCVLSSWEALQDARFGGRRISAGTSFFDPELSNQMNGKQTLSQASIDRYSVIVMGGIAAEALTFGKADGGAGDEMALVHFLSSLNASSGSTIVWNGDSIKNQARWGAMQALLLLKEYKPCYDALVSVLEGGNGKLGECVYAIEKAAKDSGLGPLRMPKGHIVDEGMYGEWRETTPQRQQQLQNDLLGNKVIGKAGSPMQQSLFEEGGSAHFENARSSKVPPPSDHASSSEESLSRYRKMIEEKLKEIDDRLSIMTKNSGKEAS